MFILKFISFGELDAFQGDRMWYFALFLAVYHVGGDLRLPAITGFVHGTTTLLFGAAIGKWIDNTSRIRGVQFLFVFFLTFNIIFISL